MHFSRTALALAASILTTEAATNGFNSGATLSDGSVKQQADYEAEFRAMASLPGSNICFTSVRLFTSIQGGSANTPISAIPAAIATQTRILLGLWASAGQGVIANEIQALQAAVKQYGSSFTDLVDGISVGSEDLYRASSIAAQQGNILPGTEPDVLAGYIDQVRSALASTALSGAKIGHVDTWTSWVNGSVSAVIKASDFLGVDAYPYFESTKPDNSIGNSNATFFSAISNVENLGSGKPIWITETGWPHTGAVSGQAVASTANAHTYWQDTGCSLFNSQYPTWWYTLRDAGSPDPTFGILPADLGAPIFNLTCPAGSNGAKGCNAGSSPSSSAATSGSSTAASPSASSVSSHVSSSVAAASAPSTTAATTTASIIQAPASVSATEASSYASSVTLAPYPVLSSANSASPASGAAPSGTVSASAGNPSLAATSRASASATISSLSPVYTGRAGKIGAAAGVGFVGVSLVFAWLL